MHVTCSFDCLIKTEGQLKDTRSHVHCQCGDIFEAVQDVVTADHYQEVIHDLSSHAISSDLD